MLLVATCSDMVNNAGFLACQKQPGSPLLTQIIKINVFNIFDTYLHYIAANMYHYICLIILFGHYSQ